MDTIKVAQNFFTKLHNMKHEELTNLISKEIGADLTQFIQNYGSKVAESTKDVDSLKKNFSTMIIIGYLLKGEINIAKGNVDLQEDDIIKSDKIH